ncbi:MAG: MATE family efflux transporter [Lachnospiraceae bacterium]|nr:MATE family efflux transporter [Lachnospiraceae bacterium]
MLSSLTGRSAVEAGFFRRVLGIAVPVTLQAMLQSSFSIVDQIMIGQLGSTAIAGAGLAGKFISIYSVIVSAVGTVAGIMIAQYLGREDRAEVRRSFFLNITAAAAVAALFLVVSLVMPERILGLYIRDKAVIAEGAVYLRLIAWTYLPAAGTTLTAALLRCLDRASYPLYAGFGAAILNTLLNYLLIFGKAGLPPLGIRGAALATLLSQLAGFVILLGLMLIRLPRCRALLNGRDPASGEALRTARAGRAYYLAYLMMLMPILANEFLWSLGENVYAVIYGRLGTDASTAMTLTNPIQGLMIGALCGLSQAAGVIIGRRLGAGEKDKAYRESRQLLICGLSGAVLLSCVVILISVFYVRLFRVGDPVRLLTTQILTAYAMVLPFKVLNMILGGGILRSGGQTAVVMVIDIIGTWLFGVPLGLLGAFVLQLPVPAIYFLLSLEEAVRFLISVIIFRRRRWMTTLKTA